MDPASMSDTLSDPGRTGDELAALRAGIRRITHDISNPLGILRMASYALQATPDDADKRAHYLSVIAKSIERVEGGLKEMRTLATGHPVEPPAENETRREP
jgi:nitrogen-specific signal transduction histidine kinase